MKTKTKFDSTSNARNLINSVVEKFPKGPERDGLQTKLREFYNCFVGAMRLPQGYDRSKVIEEGTQNLHAAQRIADRIDKQNGNAKFSTMISILASNLTDLKRDHSKTGKVEDNFYGKRVVKGIFAKAKFESRNNYIDAILNLSTLVSNAESLITNKKIDAAKKVLKQAQAIVDSNPNYKELDSQGMVQFLNKLKRKVGMSRTGSKAKFAVVGSKGNKTAIVIRNGPDADASWIAYVVQDYKTSNEDVIGNMRHYSTEARAKAAALRGLETSGLRASRQGSKAKFADDGRAKALVILQQLGGNMFVAMTGAKNLSTESNPPALSMKVGSGAQNKVKHLKVVLDEGSDTYTMIFFDSKGSTIKKVDHVYAEDLRRIFTEVTGFYTSLTRHSRTGAKVFK